MNELNFIDKETRNTASIQVTWESCDSQVFLVVDEEGNNVADAKIRHFLGKYWLLVDDLDGYQIIDANAVERLNLIVAK